MLEILKPGLETTVQELPGRIGHWEQGFPPSGPADPWSFRLANLLVGNDRDTAAHTPVPLWQTLRVRTGQVLTCGAARTGARGYIAIAGGVQTPAVLGSRATFHMAGIGGVSGGALKNGERLPLGEAASSRGLLQVAPAARPPIDLKDRTRGPVVVPAGQSPGGQRS